MTQSASQDWIATLRSTELFAALDQTTLEHLATELTEVHVTAGQQLVRQGEPGDSLFVVLQGRFDVLLDTEQVVDQLQPGAVVGEIALILGGTRQATVQASEDSLTLELSRERFDRLLEKHPEIMTPFTHALQDRMRVVRIAGYLKSLFGELEADALWEIQKQISWVHLASGEELFHQGEDADGAYIVAVGRLRVIVDERGGGERIIDEVGPGQWVGEMALLTRSARSATVYAARDTELVWLSQAVFDELIAKNPTAMLATSRLLVDRLQKQMQARAAGASAPRSGPQATTFAVLPATPEVGARAFTDGLVQTLSRYGSVLRLDASTVDARLGKDGIAQVAYDHPAHLRLTPWLIEQESAYDYVVYEAEPTWSGWNERAIRQVDHILSVVDARANSSISRVEEAMEARFHGARAPARSLILLQGPGQRSFPGTRRWLEKRQLDSHFHVRRGMRKDIERVVRILIGRAVSVVCGGGGSRGYAHVGVLQAFEEVGVPVDAIAGTSMGSLVSGPYAMGLNSQEVLALLRPILDRLIDPTLPIVSLASARRVIDGANRVIGPLDIEDLAIPYFCVSTNLTRGQGVVHRTGPMVTAMRASAAIPGIYPPVPWNGTDLLVDGGLSNNVPVDLMADFYPGLVVGIDVMPDVDLVANEGLPIYLSGWRVAWQKLNPWAESIGMPNILSILIRCVTTASQTLGKTELAADVASLYLRPPVKEWNPVDFKAGPSIAKQGFTGTIEQVRAWWAETKEFAMGRDT